MLPSLKFSSHLFFGGLKKLAKADSVIELKNIRKAFDGETVLDGIDLNIHDKEFVTFLGPSGCGKTTTLRIIAGFEYPDQGDVFIDGKKINDVPPHKRNVNTVFQRYALFPHLNVFENIAFGLRLAKKPEEEIRRRVKEMLALVNLSGFERRNVNSLSGGQQQRVAIARAIVTNPKLILADEPTGALDSRTSQEIIDIFHELHEQGNTIVLITHDSDVAKQAGRSIHILDGRITEVQR